MVRPALAQSGSKVFFLFFRAGGVGAVLYHGKSCDIYYFYVCLTFEESIVGFVNIKRFLQVHIKIKQNIPGGILKFTLNNKSLTDRYKYTETCPQ